MSLSDINTVDLETFIAEALKAVLEGIDKGQRNFSPPRTIRGGHRFAQRVQFDAPNEITFDVATTVGASSAADGGATIKVLGIGVGGKLENQNSNSTVTRISFSVPIGPKTHGSTEND